MKISSCHFIFTVLVVSIYFYTIVSGIRRKDKVKCTICPDTSLNMTGNETSAEFKRLVVKIWSQKIDLSALGRRFKKILLEINADGSPEDCLQIIIGSILLNQFIPFLEYKPDACAMAAMINGTLSCYKYYDQGPLQDGLTQLLNRFPDINYDNMMRMIMNAGCDYQCSSITPDAVTNRKECFGNGFIYPVEEYLNMPRLPYCAISERFKNILIRMYYSTNFNDNFIAVAINFGLSEVVQRLWFKRNPNYICEAARLMFSEEITSKCCYARTSRAERIREANDKGAIKSITSEKAYVKQTQCRPPTTSTIQQNPAV